MTDIETYIQENNSPDKLEYWDNIHKYTYPSINTLDTSDITTRLTYYSEFTIHICMYHINTQGDKPFIQFLLPVITDPSTSDNMINFRSTTYTSDENIEVINDTTVSVFMNEFATRNNIYQFMHNYTQGNNLFYYKGFIQSDNNFYVFYDISKYNIGNRYNHPSAFLHLCNIDELINSKPVYDIPIHPSISDFFNKYYEFTQLLDVNNVLVPQPITVYSKFKNTLETHPLFNLDTKYYVYYPSYKILMESCEDINEVYRYVITVSSPYQIIDPPNNSTIKNLWEYNQSFDSIYINTLEYQQWIINHFSAVLVSFQSISVKK